MPSSLRNAVVIDTGLLIALFDADDQHHHEARDFVNRSTATFLSTLAAVTEAMYMFGRSAIPKRNLLKWIDAGAMTLISPEEHDLKRIIELMDKYADLPMDFADGLMVAICERLDIPHIATFDSDFDVYRFKGRQRFVNVLK